VQWPDLLPGVPGSERLISEQLGHETCGLALEHLLQVTYRPVMSARRDFRGKLHDHVGAKMGAIVRSLASLSRPAQA